MSEDTKVLIRYRMERAADALLQAETLAKIGQYSGTVNRAYYAMFYAALALLLTKGLGSAKHSGVLSLFDREFVKTGEADKHWSQILHAAFKRRNRGDYDDLVEITEDESRTAIEEATAFVDWTRQWLAQRGFTVDTAPQP